MKPLITQKKQVYHRISIDLSQTNSVLMKDICLVPLLLYCNAFFLLLSLPLFQQTWMYQS